MPLVERVLGSSSSSGSSSLLPQDSATAADFALLRPFFTEVFVQYVGQPQQWRSTSSPFRSIPYKISSIPSLLAFEDVRTLLLRCSPEYKADLALFYNLDTGQGGCQDRRAYSAPTWPVRKVCWKCMNARPLPLSSNDSSHALTIPSARFLLLLHC